MKKDIKFKSIIYATIAILMLAATVVSASAYSTDLTVYPLMIKDLKLTGKNQIRFQLQNPEGSSTFDMKSLKSIETTFDKVKTIQTFVHYTGDPLTAIGEMKEGESRQFIIPFDRQGMIETELKCREPIEISIFLENGQRIAHWTGIPDCEIIGKRPEGLLKISETVAEYQDEQAGLKILWEFLDHNKDSGKVLLRKSQGRNPAEMQWVKAGDCMDIQSGECMTDIIDITFAEEEVMFTLKDNRKKRLATLTRTINQGIENTYTISQSKDKVRTANTQEAQTNNLAREAAQQIGLVDADKVKKDIACAGCSLNKRCYEKGDRNIYLNNYAYCSGDGWMIQKSNGFYCKEEYECRSSRCHENKCVNNVAELKQEEPEMNVITKVLLWIDNLF